MGEEKTEAINPVKAVCAELGITQKELAETLGVTENTVSEWAKGRNLPKMALLTFDLLREKKAHDRLKGLIREIGRLADQK